MTSFSGERMAIGAAALFKAIDEVDVLEKGKPEAFEADLAEAGGGDETHEAVFVRGAVGRNVRLGVPVCVNQQGVSQ